MSDLDELLAAESSYLRVVINKKIATKQQLQELFSLENGEEICDLLNQYNRFSKLVRDKKISFIELQELVASAKGNAFKLIKLIEHEYHFGFHNFLDNNKITLQQLQELFVLRNGYIICCSLNMNSKFFQLVIDKKISFIELQELFDQIDTGKHQLIAHINNPFYPLLYGLLNNNKITLQQLQELFVSAKFYANQLMRLINYRSGRLYDLLESEKITLQQLQGLFVSVDGYDAFRLIELIDAYNGKLYDLLKSKKITLQQLQELFVSENGNAFRLIELINKGVLYYLLRDNKTTLQRLQALFASAKGNDALQLIELINDEDNQGLYNLLREYINLEQLLLLWGEEGKNKSLCEVINKKNGLYYMLELCPPENRVAVITQLLDLWARDDGKIIGNFIDEKDWGGLKISRINDKANLVNIVAQQYRNYYNNKLCDDINAIILQPIGVKIAALNTELTALNPEQDQQLIDRTNDRIHALEGTRREINDFINRMILDSFASGEALAAKQLCDNIKTGVVDILRQKSRSNAMCAQRYPLSGFFRQLLGVFLTVLSLGTAYKFSEGFRQTFFGTDSSKMLAKSKNKLKDVEFEYNAETMAVKRA